jgi:hypothetical protein
LACGSQSGRVAPVRQIAMRQSNSWRNTALSSDRFVVAWRFPCDDRHRTLDQALAAGAIERQRWHDQNPDHKLGALCAQLDIANDEWIVSASVLDTPVLNLVREEQGTTSSGQRH